MASRGRRTKAAIGIAILVGGLLFVAPVDSAAARGGGGTGRGKLLGKQAASGRRIVRKTIRHRADREKRRFEKRRPRVRGKSKSDNAGRRHRRDGGKAGPGKGSLGDFLAQRPPRLDCEVPAGGAVLGGSLTILVEGPPRARVLLFMGPGLLDSPWRTRCGPFWISEAQLMPLSQRIGPDGTLREDVTIPDRLPVQDLEVALQALAGWRLSNALVVSIEGRPQAGAEPGFMDEPPSGDTPPEPIVLENPTPESGAHFAAAVASGDVDGDGVEDLVVGAPQANAGASDSGEVWVFFGPDLSRSRSMVDPTPASAGGFGTALICRDLDGDGRAEIITGTPGAWEGSHPAAGEVLVFWGDDTQPPLRLVSPVPAASAAFGTSLGLGDVDGDGQEDLVVGEPKGLVGSVVAGRVSVFLFPFDGQPVELVDPAPESLGVFGTAVLAADVDGDGLAEVAVGAPRADSPAGMDGGHVVLFDGPGLADASTIEADLGSFAWFGLSLSAVRIDGVARIVAGAPRADGDGTTVDPGAVVVIDGPWLGNDRNPQSQALFGQAVAAGDVDGDGRDDLVVTAPRHNEPGEANCGKAVVYLGADPATTFTVLEPTPDANAHLGKAALVSRLRGAGKKAALVLGTPDGTAGGQPSAGRLLVVW